MKTKIVEMTSDSGGLESVEVFVLCCGHNGSNVFTDSTYQLRCRQRPNIYSENMQYEETCQPQKKKTSFTFILSLS